MTAVVEHAQLLGRSARAFYLVGKSDALAYPLAFMLAIFSRLTNVFLYYFVARIVTTDESVVAGGYFAFSVVGTLVLWVLGAGLELFGSFVQRTIDQGHLELYLVQPVAWPLLPFLWFQWLVVERVVAGIATVVVAYALGVRFATDRLLLAVVVLALGVAATHAIGVIAASVRMLSKRADPVLLAYTVASTVFSGLFVPVQVLPGILQSLSWLIPHTYVVDALRQLLLDGGEASSRVSVGNAVLALGSFTVVAYAVGLVLFSKSLHYARRRGILGSY
ncbi:MAG TPA: ABC transporter permease [Acidimicrobiales bacterium]|nr:ABC transporter permease [Acidimicrobiales bacterium]